jgi:hypothetical protein
MARSCGCAAGRIEAVRRGIRRGPDLHVRFHDCDLTGADFRGARLQACELRRSNLSGIEHASGLRGASLEWPYVVELAGVWAAELGIGVLDQYD